ncbi:hypothetical protein FSP39_007185 [Pinctada imbricata]|uniref:SWIM-type domain-containing protein n=1 Tax=Pinctada imbricata TaxID=66713 RepID=A0AA89BQS1_PINIB|nr:hypothetical protein FSP39_007185 [Pinctada imbricata]
MPRRYKCTLCKREPNQRERRNVTADQRTLLERRFGVRPANDSVLCNRCRYKCYLILKKKEKKVASETEAPALPLNNDASLIELPLPSAPRGHASCCICRKASQKLIVMSAAMRHQAFMDRGRMITAGSRCCPVHVNDDILSDNALGLLKASSDISVIKGDALIELLQYLRTTAHRHEKTRLNFDDERSLSDEEYLSLLGVGKAAFKDMLTYLDGLVRNTPARSTKTSLAIFLLKMRSGMSNKMLSTVFNVSKSSIRRCISNVSNVLKEKFVSESLGFQSISRSDVINNHTRKLAQTLFCDDGKSQAVLVLDGTYIYIQKSGHFRFQRQSFSIHKGRPLVKPMIIVSTDGHFISVLGPYLAKDNDASILKNALLRNVDEMREWLDEKDIFIVDRGFRDALPYLKELGIQAEMPTFLRKGETQMSTEDANSSRLVTKVRWVVESANARIKQWRYLDHILPTNQIPYIGDYIRIVCSITNRYFPPFSTGSSEADDALGARMLFLSKQVNSLKEYVDDKNLHRRSASWVAMEEIKDFPRLDEEQLLFLTCGTYQLKLSANYTQEHLDGNCDIHGHKDENGLLRVRIRSRHVSAKTYLLWIRYDECYVTAWYCRCRTGSRVVGMCAHVAAVIWFLGNGRHQQTEKYGVQDWSTFLEDASKVPEAIDQSDDEENIDTEEYLFTSCTFLAY